MALLCAVCHRPELLLLDEPAGGLDPVARREFLETSIQLLNREGTAILFSSHNMSDVERIGGRIVLLDKGKVRIDRDLDRIREDICVAMIPRASVPDAAALERVPGCLRVRQVYDDWHAVVEGDPERLACNCRHRRRRTASAACACRSKSCSSSWWAGRGRGRCHIRWWGGPPGPRPTPPSARAGRFSWREAGPGVRPTISAAGVAGKQRRS